MNAIIEILPQLSFPLISSIVAAVFALVSFIIARRTERRQAAVQSQDILLQFDMAVRAWGRDAIEALAALEAATWQCDDFEFTKQLSRVSGMIDQGRLLLPNTPRHDGADIHKPKAYQGYRPPVLNNLFTVYDFAAGLTVETMGPDAAGNLFKLRRDFVAELVIALDTKRNKLVMSKLDKTVRSQFASKG